MPLLDATPDLERFRVTLDEFPGAGPPGNQCFMRDADRRPVPFLRVADQQTCAWIKQCLDQSTLRTAWGECGERNTPCYGAIDIAFETLISARENSTDPSACRSSAAHRSSTASAFVAIAPSSLPSPS